MDMVVDDTICSACGEPKKYHVGGPKRGLCKNRIWADTNGQKMTKITEEMTTDEIDEIREMFRNEDYSTKLSRSDVLRIVEILAQQRARRTHSGICPNCETDLSTTSVCSVCGTRK